MEMLRYLNPLFSAKKEVEDAEERLDEAKKDFEKARADLKTYSAGELIATYKAGENHAPKVLQEYEKLCDCEFVSMQHDTTTYVFGPGTTEAQINDWAQNVWPTRVVSYTTSGIEFH